MLVYPAAFKVCRLRFDERLQQQETNFIFGVKDVGSLRLRYKAKFSGDIIAYRARYTFPLWTPAGYFFLYSA